MVPTHVDLPTREFPVPIFPRIEDFTRWDCLPYFLSMLCAGLIGWALMTVFRHNYGTKQPLLILIPVMVMVVLPLRFGFGPELLQGGVLCFAILYAACLDSLTREVPDYIPVLIAVAALIGREPSNLPVLLLSAVIITIPQLAIAIIKPKSYGGADIKIMAACAFLLGLRKGLAAIVIGLLLAVVCTTITRRVKKQPMGDGIALVPYLAIGSMLAYLS